MPINIQKYSVNTLASTIILLDVVFFCWVWTRFKITLQYNLQLIGILTVIYIAYHVFLEKKLLSKTEVSVLNIKSFIFTAIILLFISSTGSINSSFFFLLYFLTIGVALLLKPVISAFLALSLSAYFWPEVSQGDYVSNLIKIASLIIMNPIAIFFAKEYLKVQEQEKKITIFKNAQKIYKSELEKIQDDIGLWTSFKIKGPLSAVKHLTYELLNNRKLASAKKQKEYLQKIYASNEKALEDIGVFEKMAEEEIGQLQSKVEVDKLKQEIVFEEKPT